MNKDELIQAINSYELPKEVQDYIVALINDSPEVNQQILDQIADIIEEDADMDEIEANVNALEAYTQAQEIAEQLEEQQADTPATQQEQSTDTPPNTEANSDTTTTS